MPLSGLHSGQSPPDQTRSWVFKSVVCRSSAKSIAAWAWRASKLAVLSLAPWTHEACELLMTDDAEVVPPDVADTEIGAPGVKRSSLGPGAGTLWRS